MVYRTEYTEFYSLNFYWIGWKWGYAVMRILDTNGVSKLRLAKCMIKREFPETEMYEWVKLDSKEVGNLKQIQKINFKSLDELEACFKELRKELIINSVNDESKLINEEEIISNF